VVGQPARATVAAARTVALAVRPATQEEGVMVVAMVVATLAVALLAAGLVALEGPQVLPAVLPYLLVLALLWLALA